MSNVHYIETCKICGTTMSQCRCPGPKTVRYSICSNCGKPLTQNSMNRQVELAIRQMSSSFITEKSIANLLSLWGMYFQLIQLPQERQLELFYKIVGKRLYTESVLTPPEIPETV